MALPQGGPATPSRLLQLHPATPADIPTIRRLADLIWRACYPSLLSPAQIDYMLAWMYSAEKLDAEIRGSIRYFIALLESVPVGYLALEQPQPPPTDAPATLPTATLHKLYLDPALHGRGLGSEMLQFAFEQARALGAASLALRVNKRNAPALAAYQRNGFQIIDAITADIGGGFVMDDYLMARPLHPDATVR